jgi:hypothetical protein
MVVKAGRVKTSAWAPRATTRARHDSGACRSLLVKNDEKNGNRQRAHGVVLHQLETASPRRPFRVPASLRMTATSGTNTDLLTAENGGGVGWGVMVHRRPNYRDARTSLCMEWVNDKFFSISWTTTPTADYAAHLRGLGRATLELPQGGAGA